MTGVSGTVASRYEDLAGYIWLWVAPLAHKPEEGKVPDQIGGDECLWEPVGELRLERPETPAEDMTPFELGAYVKDVVSGFRGIITGRTESFARCLGYDVTAQGKYDKDGHPIHHHFQGPRLELIEDMALAVPATRTGCDIPHEPPR
jgi:hypothetical protein